MRYVGFSEYFHDAGLAIVSEEGNIDFASHAERFSKIKFDPVLHKDLKYKVSEHDHVTYYEDVFLREKKMKEIMTNNRKHWELGVQNSFYDKILNHEYSLEFDEYISHHQSHAANGFYTRPWDDVENTVIISMDGVGEFESHCMYDHKFNKKHAWVAPKSLGLTYTKVTKMIGLRSMEDEFVTMGLASFGEPVWGDEMYEWFKWLNGQDGFTKKQSPRPWVTKMERALEDATSKGQSKAMKVVYDMSASVQYMTEKVMIERAKLARKYGSKLILTGGVAQNIVCASQIRDIFDDMWIPIAPNDAGSALGAAAWSYSKATGKTKVNWEHPYLGHNIDREINPKEVVAYLLKNKVCGVANGRAEFGPRALGNRSLLADARYDVKDTVNKIKKRQLYRPFAPAILEEYAHEYFEGHMNEYMQYQCKALHDYSSVTHVDGTARVQLVRKDSPSILRQILEEFYNQTGVPMLLNTSLNIRGQPMVNDERDAAMFEERYNVKVF